MKGRFLEWVNRYKYPELAASLSIITVGIIANHLEINKVLKSFLLTWTEFIAFYTVVLFLQLKKSAKAQLNFNFLTKELAKLFIEFGPAAVLDFLIIRPFFMYHLPIWTFNNLFGILLGKITADLFFYTQTVLSYEWIKYSANKKKYK